MFMASKHKNKPTTVLGLDTMGDYRGVCEITATTNQYYETQDLQF